MNIYEYEEIQLLINDLCEKVIVALITDIKNHGRASLILSGGNTPKLYLESLASYAVDWSKVTISLTDERNVSNTHIDSNENLIKKLFLEQGAGSANFLPLYNNPNILENIGYLNRNVKYSELTYSAVIFGMGIDGHFASIFADSEYIDDALFDPVNLYSHQIAYNNICSDRITMNLCALAEAKNIFLPIIGNEKITIFNKAKERLSKSLPISFLINDYSNKLSVFISQ